MKAAIGDTRICSIHGYEFTMTEKGWVRTHRLVWEAAHGPLSKSQVVHHKDGNRLNNALKNLEAMTYSAHAKLHNNGSKRTETVKKAMSELAKQRNAKPEYNALIRSRAKKQHEEGKLGAATWNEKTAEKWAVTKEERSKRSTADLKALWANPEFRAKMMVARKKQWTPERRKAQAERARAQALVRKSKQNGA